MAADVIARSLPAVVAEARYPLATTVGRPEPASGARGGTSATYVWRPTLERAGASSLAYVSLPPETRGTSVNMLRATRIKRTARPRCVGA